MLEKHVNYGCGRIGSKRRVIVLASIAMLLLGLLRYQKHRFQDVVPSLSTWKDPKSILSSSSIQSQGSDNILTNTYKEYVPANTERYILDHATELGYASEDNPDGCTIFTDPNVTNTEVYQQLTSYLSDLEHNYIPAVENFQPKFTNVLNEIINSKGQDNSYHDDVCSSIKLHPEGVRGLFPNSQLSYSRTGGYVEPLLPPMRSYYGTCDISRGNFLSLDYLVHDFETMCRKLKPHSRMILVDMGASLNFHGGDTQPIIGLLKQYEKFGFQFEHIYAFEITFSDPNKVYEDLLPLEYMPSYHWINVGVSPVVGSKLNPLYSILQHFHEDDFVVVKLDIDTSFIEVPLAQQLLEGGENGIYHRLVDQFYFEHHVHLGNLAWAWAGSMNGTIQDSLELFHGLRMKGIPSHFWP